MPNNIGSFHQARTRNRKSREVAFWNLRESTVVVRKRKCKNKVYSPIVGCFQSLFLWFYFGTDLI